MSNSSPYSDSERLELAKLLFPDWQELPGIEELESRYQDRDLPAGAFVTRVAPSPTGFAHLGLAYTSLANWKLAKQTQGVFILRVEDTDEKREIKGAFETIIRALDGLNLSRDEGFFLSPNGEITEIGEYGPYLQSRRKGIYRGIVFEMVKSGKAYPCFCNEEELRAIADEQALRKLRPGYYGPFAKWRDAPLDKIKESLSEGKKFVMRIRSFGDPLQRVSWNDGVKGTVSMPENDLDMVILKSDGQSLYHLAHAVDDHFMKITHVMRGDEWLSSVPLHMQIFQSLNWEHPHYSHLPTIQKLDTATEEDPETGNMTEKQVRRKLSKRKDPEANIDYYWQEGFPSDAITEYLLNILNSDFEDWRRDNPTTSHTEFSLKFEKLPVSGALADLVKLTSISKDVIGRMAIEELYQQALRWAERFDADLATLMKKDEEYTRRCLNIEREGAKPSKRISTWKDVRPQTEWLFDEIFENLSHFDFPEHVSEGDRKEILKEFNETLNMGDSRDEWFARCKEIAAKLGFAPEMKLFKKEPTKFKGHIGDVTMVIRVALCASRQSPDLHEVIQVLGESRVKARTSRFC